MFYLHDILDDIETTPISSEEYAYSHLSSAQHLLCKVGINSLILQDAAQTHKESISLGIGMNR